MMNRLQGFMQPMPLVQHKPQLKLLFGFDHKYEKAVSVNISNTPVEHVSLANPPKTANFFVRPGEQLSALFDKIEGGSAYLANFVKSLIEKQGLATDGKQNLFTSLPKAPKGEKQPEAAMARRIGTAFNNALGQMPKDARELTISLPPLSAQSSITAVARELAEQATLQGYNPYFQRPNAAAPFNLQSVQLANLPSTAETTAAVHEGKVIGQSTNLARYMVDSSPPFKNPLWLSNVTKALETNSKHGTMRVDILQKADLEREKMGMALAVAAGNQTTDADQIRMPVMTYTPKNGQYDKTIMLVGKGIVFDTGGVNLKTGSDPETGNAYIHGMHGDMAGAAAVVGAMKAIDDMQLQGVRVVGITPFTPNRIGPDASLPETIAYARNGKSVCISNTDAEGRLILGDAINYGGEKFKPDLIVDIATLTGGKVAALGDVNSVAVMGNSMKLSKRVKALETQGLGRKAEAIELTQAHKNWVTDGGKGKADVFNSVGMKSAEAYKVFGEGVKFERSKHIIHHSAQGGAFLREFLPNAKTPWVHLDMAGAEFAKNQHLGKISEFATGFGVKDLYSIVKATADGSLLGK